jgi:hypothetical protein
MNPRFLQACESCQSAEKACWEILMRELPGAERIPANVLETAMDRALTQLWRVLHEETAERRLAAARAELPVVRPDERCSLAAHLPYFNAGQRALELVASEVERMEPEFQELDAQVQREELVAAFDLLVQCQLEALCQACARAGTCEYSDRRNLTPAKPEGGASRRSTRQPGQRRAVKRRRPPA